MNQGNRGMQQDAEKVRQRRSRLLEILNVPHSGNELSWQLGDGRVRKGTPPVSTRLRPCWTGFLSILREYFTVVPLCRCALAVASLESVHTYA